MFDDLPHRATYRDHPLWWYSFAKQILPRDAAVGKIDIADVVDDLAIDLLGNALIEAAVTSFKMEDRNVAAFGRNYGKAAIGIPENHERLRTILREHRVELDDGVSDRGCGVRTRRPRDTGRV